METKKNGSRLNEVEAPLSRRQFLQRVGTTSLLAATAGGLGWLAYSDEPVRRVREVIHTLKDFRVADSALYPRLAVVRGEAVEPMVREAVNKLGGINRFIARGDTVLLKPNVGWDRQPEQAANTNPQVVAAVVLLCREAGAKAVWVTDVSINDPRRCFARSGIEAAVQAAGGEVRIPGDHDFLATDMKGTLLKVWPVSRFFHQVDKVINLPIVKNHSLSGCTLAMKNWYGLLGGQRNQLHQDIHTSIVDLAQALRPTLTIVDAIRVLKRNGPTGGNLEDVFAAKSIIAGVDEVALDSFSLGFLDLTPEQVPYLALGEKKGLGVVDWRSLNRTESQIG